MQPLTNATLWMIQRRLYELLAGGNRKNQAGQDLIEYALMVGFIAVAAGAVIPGVVTSIRSIFEKISGALVNSASQE